MMNIILFNLFMSTIIVLLGILFDDYF